MSAVPDRIDELPRRWLANAPQRIAIDDGARRVSWSALDDAIVACADMLADAGVRRGDRVMVVAENSVALVATQRYPDKLSTLILYAFPVDIDAKRPVADDPSATRHPGPGCR